MPEIIPRWEWRWFGPHFGPATSILAAMTPSAVQESNETYLLSGAGDNVKVRDALMDIKVLREVSPDGLEQWTPVMKAGFPLSATDATKVFEALRLTPPSMRRENYTLEQFIEELAVPSGHIRAISVQKRRTRYRIDGCSGEVTDVVVNGRPTRTIAVESEDGQAVIAAVRRLGLGGYTNINYPRGLAALVDGRAFALRRDRRRHELDQVPRRRAGTPAARGAPSSIVRRSRGSARAWPTRSVSPRPRWTGRSWRSRGWSPRRERTTCWPSSPSAPRACASPRTAPQVRRRHRGARRDPRRGDLGRGRGPARLRRRPVEPRPGRWLDGRVRHRRRQHPVHVRARRGAYEERFSLDIGAVRYTEQFGLDGIVTTDVLRQGPRRLVHRFSRLDGRPAPDALAAMGGATTNIAAVKHGLARYDPDSRPGHGAGHEPRSTGRSSSTDPWTPTHAVGSSACSPSGPR